MIHAFGEIRWDDELFELRRCGEPISVAPRVLDALAYLIKHRARVVSKDELLRAVWKDIAVSDASLSQIIMLARKAVGDEGGRQQVIKTVRGRGFRFAAPVTELRQEKSAEQAIDAKLLERSTENARLRRRFEAAERGAGSLVLVEGEPGIGKTTLAEQFCAWARARGKSVLWGRAWEEGGAPPFWPWIQVLRALARQLGGDALREALGPHPDALLSLLSNSIEIEPRASELEALCVGRAQERFRVFDAVTRALRLAVSGANKPLIVVLDDLHAADDASIELLRFLSQDVGEMALVVLAMFRDLAIPPQTALALFLGGPLENTERLSLRGFSTDQVRVLFESVTLTPASERTALLLHELSNGNPFLVHELGRLHSDLDRQRGNELGMLASMRVPERMARAVRLRVGELPEQTRELLEVASVLGREARVAELATLVAVSDKETLARLAPALARGLVSMRGASVSFCHSLVQGTLYAELDPSRRVDLHRRAGEQIEAARVKPDGAPYELARHFLLAATGASTKALRYTFEAARSAERRLAFSTAASLYDASVALAEIEPAQEPSLLLERLLAAGHAFYRAGEVETAVLRYRRAADVARAAGAAESFAWAVFYYGFARSGSMLFDPALLELIREALRALPEADSALRAMLLGHSAVRFNSLGEKAARLETTGAAVAMARSSGDDYALTIALSAQLWQLSGAVDAQSELEIASEFVAVARRARQDTMLLNALQQRIAVRLKLADFRAADADFGEFAELAASQGHPTHRYWAELIRASWVARAGRFEEALERSRSASRAGVRIQEPLAPVFHALQTAQFLFEQGRGGELVESALEVLPRDEVPSTRAMWLVLFLGCGDTARAYQNYSELAADDFASIPEDLHRLWILCALAYFAALLGDVARSERLYALLAPSAELAAVAPGTLHYLGPVARFLGLLASARGEHERAISHFEDALRQCDRAGAMPKRAQVEAEYGRALLASPCPDRELAGVVLARSLEAAERLGMLQLAQVVRDLPC